MTLPLGNAEGNEGRNRNVAPGNSCLPRAGGLWPFYLITTAYLVLGIIVALSRWGEIGNLLHPHIDGDNRLALNSIGDVLAGFFAPLAFLWLFAATQLQRQELTETRLVLQEQREELERSAEESNRQTKIMQLTLDSARSKEIYDSHNLKLYFLAMKILRANNTEINRTDNDTSYMYTQNFIVYDFASKVSQTDPSSIDMFYDYLYQRMDHFYDALRSGSEIYIATESQKEVLEFFDEIIPELENLINLPDGQYNDLVQARVVGMRLYDLNNRIAFLSDRVRLTPINANTSN